MSDQPCGVCPGLQARINYLTGVNAHLNRTLTLLRRLFAAVVAGVRATEVFAAKEIEAPTMPRRELVPAVVQRLAHVVDIAEGRR
ncbi:hypothetical protein GCM10010124_00140 [Pilimelia terevasa]|uniref:Uncharacterized protein n=1 Tax=Pilimelia terevasa TaxID=53372 RepID=A0A8J3BFK8_9ACTN|nr:hypothetical protein [Pilimelia terevasa]GGK11484.1 hypothetical protein GCM10010124_00140 [Pilimelia terevasa]